MLLLVFFLLPMILMVRMSLLRYPPSTFGGYSFVHYGNVLSDPIYRRIAVNTFVIATAAQLLMLALGIPLAYIMAFKAGRWELLLLLLLVLADELNPIVKIYAWRMLLGHDGLVNWVLIHAGIVREPVSWLLFGRFAVIVTLATSWITYTTIPIYAAMKAIDPGAVPGRGRPGRELVDQGAAAAGAAGGAGDLHRDDPGLHPDVHRLRHEQPGGRHELVHAGQRRQRPDPVHQQLGRTGRRSTSSCWCCPWGCRCSPTAWRD